MNDDLRDILSAELAVEPSADVPAADVAPTSSPSADASQTTTGERARDDKGRFAPTTKETTVSDHPEPTANLGSAPAASATKVPVGWSKRSDAFLSLSPELQQAIIEREAEVDAGFRDRAAKLKGYEPLTPVIQYIQSRGHDPAEYLGQLLNLAAEAERDMPAFVRRLAQQCGLSLAQDDPNAPSQQQTTDPNIATLAQRLQMTERYILQQHQQMLSADENRRKSSVEAIYADAESYPLLSEVETEMEPYVRLYRSQNPQAEDGEVLKRAYETAVWANPAIREKALQSQRQADADRARDVADRAKKAAGAKATQGKVVGAEAVKGLDLRSILEQQLGA